MAEFGKCHGCGMTLLKPGEFHPHAACVLYKHTGQAEKVEGLTMTATPTGSPFPTRYDPTTAKIRHASDCSANNAPALKPGPCDCGAEVVQAARRLVDWMDQRNLILLDDPRHLCLVPHSLLRDVRKSVQGLNE